MVRARDHHCVAFVDHVCEPPPAPTAPPPAPMRAVKRMGMLSIASPTAPAVSWLVLLSGPQVGTTIRLPPPPFTVGSGPADVVLDDDSLAPVHLVFDLTEGLLEAYDARLPAGSRERTASALDLRNSEGFLIGRTRCAYKSLMD